MQIKHLSIIIEFEKEYFDWEGNFEKDRQTADTNRPPRHITHNEPTTVRAPSLYFWPRNNKHTISLDSLIDTEHPTGGIKIIVHYRVKHRLHLCFKK
jgi:hypothetical protein